MYAALLLLNKLWDKEMSQDIEGFLKSQQRHRSESREGKAAGTDNAYFSQTCSNAFSSAFVSVQQGTSPPAAAHTHSANVCLQQCLLTASP